MFYFRNRSAARLHNVRAAAKRAAFERSYPKNGARGRWIFRRAFCANVA